MDKCSYYKVGDIWYAYKCFGKRRVRISTGCKDRLTAERWYALNSQLVEENSKRIGYSDIPDAYVKRLMTDVRARCRRYGRTTNLSTEKIEAMYYFSGGLCTLTGLRFSFERHGYRRSPFAPSIDRIDSAGDYTEENCRLICVALNVAMSDFGEDVFSVLAKSYVANITP